MRWWEGLGEVDVEGPDEAREHRLVWRRGALHLAAHPDPEAELALGALGGEPCPCLDVWLAWHDAHGDGAVLTVGARHHLEAVAAPAGPTTALRADLRRWRATSGSLVEEARRSRNTRAIDRIVAVAGPAELEAGRRLGFLLLLALDQRLLHRLQASVAAGLADDTERWPQLQVATAARAVAALSALGWRGGLRSVRLGDEPALHEAAATLPPSWLAQVWGRGLESAVAGHLVVDVTAVTSEGAFEVTVMAPGKSGVARCVVPVGE